MRRMSTEIGAAWVKQKKVQFLQVKITAAGVGLLKAITDKTGEAFYVLVPNRYKQGPKAPDYRAFLGWIEP